MQWVPGGGHLLQKAPGIDRTLRSVANRFGLTDMGQRGGTHAGERAEPNLPAPKPQERMYEPMPGMRVPWSDTPTAGFSDRVFPMGKSIPINGPKFGGVRRHIPTTVVGK